MYYAMPSQTEKGIRQITYAILAFILTNILSIVIVVLILPILSSILSGTINPSMLGAAIGLLAGACALILIELIGLIFGLLGVLAVHRGRNEFGPEHGRMLDRATIMLVVGIILLIVGSSYSSVAGGGLGGGLVPSTALGAAAAVGAVGIAGSVLIGLFLMWLVDALNTPAGKQRALIALILGVLSGVLAIVIEVVVFATLPIVVRPQDFVQYLILPSIVGGAVSIVSIVLWYLVYRGVLDRFKSGELRPAPPMPMYPPPYPGYAPPYVPAAPYYPPQPPAAPPQQPPPATPPPNP